jgi:hypothetical protein
VAYKSNQDLGAGVASNALNTNQKVFTKAVAGRGIKNMDNYSGPFLTLHRLCKDFYEATMQGEYARAYEISLDITEMAQKLEDFAKGLRDAYTN